MYDNLVRQLRTCIDENIPCENADCGYKPFGNEDCIDQLMRRAADAIEELELHYCPHAIHNEHDRGDDSLCRVLGAEPPKEET